jgi:hypothetical protein
MMNQQPKLNMKISNYRNHNALILMITGVLLIYSYTDSPAISSEARLSRAGVASSAFAQINKGSARLTIRRFPNLGNNVVVVLTIDGVAVTPIGYGHTYDGLLPAGRHVLSVSSTPNLIWRTSGQMTLDVRNGQTYTFTAMDDGSGDLILKGG